MITNIQRTLVRMTSGIGQGSAPTPRARQAATTGSDVSAEGSRFAPDDELPNTYHPDEQSAPGLVEAINLLVASFYDGQSPIADEEYWLSNLSGMSKAFDVGHVRVGHPGSDVMDQSAGNRRTKIPEDV